MSICPLISFFFFFNDTATTEIYTLSLHDALPISTTIRFWSSARCLPGPGGSSWWRNTSIPGSRRRSEEHTSELQSPCNLVCRLLLEKKKIRKHTLVLLSQSYDVYRYVTEHIDADN